MTDLIGSSGLLPEIVAKATVASPHAAATPGVAAAGRQHWGSVSVGSRPGDVIFKVTGWSFGTPTPQIVLCQARQNDNLDHGWSDQFAIQVIETARDFVRVRIRRLDSNGSGWGQNLRVDIFVIE